MPRGRLPSLNPLSTWSTTATSGLRATWLGHSTVLIEIDGVRVLTDPVWGPRASPSTLAGPKRFQPVPVTLRALPPIELVIVSHDHYDHLDYPTIRELAKRTCRSSRRWASAPTSKPGASARAHRRARLVGVARARGNRAQHHRRALAALLGPRPGGPQPHAVVVAGDSFGATHGILQRRTGLTPSTRDPRGSGPSIW